MESVNRVIISRRWKGGQRIEAYANVGDVGCSISLDDFLSGLTEELLRAPELRATGITEDQLRNIVFNACSRTTSEVKKATRYVV